MQSSDTTIELVKALVKAQSEFPSVPKSKENPLFHSSYATLDDVLQAVTPVLSKNGLAVVQPLSSDENGSYLETRLMHTSGEWMSTIVAIPTMPGNRGTNELQMFGSSLTYMRRYMLSSLLGVNTEDDDDGNTGQKGKEKPKATPEQKGKITQAIKDLGLSDVNKSLNDAGFPVLAKLTQEQAKAAITRLEKAVKEKKEKEKKGKSESEA